MVKDLQPSVFFIEETKFKEEGKFKIDNFVIFELVRDSKEGGGLALGCAKELNPVLVRKGDEEVEAMSVDISVKSMRIRCVVAYGCQENSLVEKKHNFWSFIEEEVISSWNSGYGFILQCDGNLWAGPEIIPGDPRQQNNNGKLFKEFLSKNPKLTVVNGLSLCEGVITRIRNKNGIEEKSVLDFFIVCSRVLPYVTKMVIDVDKKHILTNYKNAKDGRKATDTDHMTEYMDLNLQAVSAKPERKEIYNFKDNNSLVTFQEMTSNTQEFSNCFQNDLPLQQQLNNWRKVLKSHVQASFKKIRINGKKCSNKINPKMSSLIDERNKLVKSSLSDIEKIQVEKLEKTISSMQAEDNYLLIMKNFKRFSDNPENINLQEIWKILKTIGPKHGSTLPIAKKDHKGVLISDPKEIKKLLAKEYRQRLRSRPLRPDLIDLKQRRKYIFKMQMKLAEGTSSKPWIMKDLNNALRDLKNKKSRDHAGYVNEIFKHGVIGTNLKQSLLLMFNKLKLNKLIPSFMQFANITTVPKRGSLTLLENERGIFRVDITRSILMRLIYNEKYPVIDSNMSDSQMGGRKGRGCRMNLFIVNGIIHDIIKSKHALPALFGIFDYSQMFDSIKLQQAISDIYEAGLKDENLSLLYQANKEIYMAVNTPGGLSERQMIEDSVLQGDTWGSLLASVQVDDIGQECAEAGHGYRYKNILPIGMLGLVDDIIGITEPGFKAQMLNAFLNIKTAEKGLQFGVKKCKSMLIAKNTENILNSSLCVDKWNVEHRVEPSGDTTLVESYGGQVQIEKCSEQKYLGFILSSSGDNMANIRSIRNKSIGTIRKIFSKLNSLHLQKYYFECGILFMNIMLRSSILYACETYYNLKENEIRQLERIEESFMRQLLKTKKGCPIYQMYRELAQIPARFDIYKIQLFFLKNILDQEEDCMISKFFHLQVENPVKGDWASSCSSTLKKLDINLSLEDIKQMSVNIFSCLVKL